MSETEGAMRGKTLTKSAVDCEMESDLDCTLRPLDNSEKRRRSSNSLEAREVRRWFVLVRCAQSSKAASQTQNGGVENCRDLCGQRMGMGWWAIGPRATLELWPCFGGL